MTPIHAVVPVYLAACLILGGASAAGFMANLLLQLAAIPLIAASLLVRRQSPLSASGTSLLMLAATVPCLVAFQLVPLPPELWTALPGREAIAQDMRMIGLQLPWLPMSLAPHRTFYSLLWLLPAFAVLLGALRLGAFRPSWLAWSILALAVLSVGIGALQVAAGPQSAWYFYDVTNLGFAVGFFANNNHMATLLLISMPFLAVLKATALGRRRRSARDSSGVLVLTTTIALILIVGLAINTSLAGLGLAIPTALASVLLVRSQSKPVPRWAFPLLGAIAVAGVALVLSSPMGNNLTTEEARTTTSSRYTTFSQTLAASAEYFPVGSGVGTFQQVYRARENPADATTEYINHAHSDLIELLLETGLPGAILFILFLWWWIRRLFAIWRATEPDPFARAATIASAAVLAHSAVDYPLRTAAISALFALCLALMAEPRPKVRRSERSRDSARHLSAEED